MTQLRDARLRKALDAAPDAQMQPHARTRAAIRAAAHGAAQPAWRRWWTRAGTHPMPWTAALATLAVATLVTVTWQGREPPVARPDAPSAPAPAAAPTVTPQAEPPAAAVSAPEQHADRASPARRPAPAAVPERAATDALAKSAAREETRARADAPTPPPAPAAPVAPAPAAPPAASVAPPAPAALPAPQRQAAPAPPAAALRAAPVSLPWTQVRLEADGRSVVVPRPQAGNLPALLTSMLASTSDEAQGAAPASLKLELAQGDETLGVLEAVGEDWRWTPLRSPGPARRLHADAGVSAALRTEAQRLLRR